MSFWKRVFGRKPHGGETCETVVGATARAATACDDAREDLAGRVGVSRILPEFPLTPLNAHRDNRRLEGALLADLATIGHCICDGFEAARVKMDCGRWPGFADRELMALRTAYAKMSIKAGAVASVDRARVVELVRAYVKQVVEQASVYERFEKGELTVYNMTIDFANTIGFGGPLQTALEWMQRGW